MSRPPGAGSLTRMFVRFWPYLREQRWLAAGSLLALLAEVALRVLEPWPLKLVFDGVLGRRAHGRVVLPAEWTTEWALLACAAAVLAIAALRAGCAYANTVGFALVGNRVLTRVRNELFQHLQRLSLSFHARAGSGDLVVRVIGDVGLLKDVVVTAVLPLAANVFVVLGMVAVMVWLNWRLAVASLAVLPLFWLSTVRLGRRIREVSRLQRRREGRMAAQAAESIGGVRTVRALGLEDAFGRLFERQSARELAQGVKAKRLEAALERSVDLAVAAATALVLWYGATLALQGHLTPGELLVFLAYFKTGFKPVKDSAKYMGRLAKAAAAGERVLDLLDREPEVRDLPGAVAAARLRGGVRFDGVTFGHEPGSPVLRGVQFEVTGGARVAVVGPSGAGKSTLLSLLLRLHDPWTGSVLVDGVDVRRYTLESLRRQIAVVPQDTLLFAASVRDNIAHGAPDADDAAVERAARLANAHDFISALPEGYQSVLGERGVTLSTGQRQRIAIARAAIRDASILALDEPATGLDEENERFVLEALERLADGRTTFLVTHDLRVAARADHILYVDGGRVVEQGSHEPLLEAGGRYAALYRLQWPGAPAVAAARDHVVSG